MRDTPTSTALRLGFAGLTIEGRFDWQVQVDELRLPFLVSSPSQATVYVHQVPVGEEPYGDRQLAVVRRSSSDWDVVQLSPERVGIARRDREGRRRLLVIFDQNSTDVEFLDPPPQQSDNPHTHDFAYPYRFPAMALLAKQGGLLLHGCSVRQQERGWLFLGHPGVGKTTMGRLWQSRQGAVLNDEYSIVRSCDGRIDVCGTPWLGTGRMCAAGQARLERVFFLEHGLRNVLSPVRPVEAFSRLLEHVYLPLWDEAALEAAIATCASLAGELAFYRFGFVPQPEAVDFLILSQL
jgi:hypothetical protein